MNAIAGTLTMRRTASRGVSERPNSSSKSSRMSLNRGLRPSLAVSRWSASDIGLSPFRTSPGFIEIIHLLGSLRTGKLPPHVGPVEHDQPPDAEREEEDGIATGERQAGHDIGREQGEPTATQVHHRDAARDGE